jgi:crystallin, alpha B
MSIVPISRLLNFERPWQTEGNLFEQNNTTANLNRFKDGKIQISLDVHHFAPEDVAVKTVGNTVIVEGKHEERLDEFGSVERHFVRKYLLPLENATSDVESTMSSDGVLTVTILPPAKVEGANATVVPIHRTGPVHLTHHDYKTDVPVKTHW